MANAMCNCEHAKHFDDEPEPQTGHDYMAVPAGKHSAMFVGPVCDKCAETCMSKYLVKLEEAKTMSAKFYVAVYEIDRRYGDSEEGGWWYNSGDLVHSETTFTEAFAQFRADKLCKEYPHTGKVYSVNYRGGDFSVQVDNVPPADHYPEYRPHYE
jgi:hypothetical protein